MTLVLNKTLLGSGTSHTILKDKHISKLKQLQIENEIGPFLEGISKQARQKKDRSLS